MHAFNASKKTISKIRSNKLLLIDTVPRLIYLRFFTLPFQIPFPCGAFPFDEKGNKNKNQNIFERIISA
jgi:hypothetical protein